MRASGTEGYGETADTLVEQYESLSFEDVHRRLLPLLPAPPARVVDIGAGTGRDAAALCRLGHAVTAVEPTAEMRAHGRRRHAALPIRWLDDSLPELARVRALDERFDVVLLSAVWMHLDGEQRAAALPHVAALLAPGGLLALSLRHGPVPAGRRMFEVSTAETQALAASCGLVLAHASEGSSALRAPGVSWSRLAFRMP
ncbi:MAG: class I SAM-dependent methyltransferase [Reyranellaceae bacterium]